MIFSYSNRYFYSSVIGEYPQIIVCYMGEGYISGYAIWLRGFNTNVMLRIDDDI